MPSLSEQMLRHAFAHGPSLSSRVYAAEELISVRNLVRFVRLVKHVRVCCVCVCCVCAVCTRCYCVSGCMWVVCHFKCYLCRLILPQRGRYVFPEANAMHWSVRAAIAEALAERCPSHETDPSKSAERTVYYPSCVEGSVRVYVCVFATRVMLC